MVAGQLTERVDRLQVHVAERPNKTCSTSKHIAGFTIQYLQLSMLTLPLLDNLQKAPGDGFENKRQTPFASLQLVLWLHFMEKSINHSLYAHGAAAIFCLFLHFYNNAVL